MSVFSLVSGRRLGSASGRRLFFKQSLWTGKAREYYDKAAKERQKRKPAGSVPEKLPEQKGDARDAAGKALDVSGRKR